MIFARCAGASLVCFLFLVVVLFVSGVVVSWWIVKGVIVMVQKSKDSPRRHTLPLSNRYRYVVDHWRRVRVFDTIEGKLLLEDFCADVEEGVGSVGEVVGFRFDMSVRLPFDVPDKDMVGFEDESVGILEGYESD